MPVLSKGKGTVAILLPILLILAQTLKVAASEVVIRTGNRVGSAEIWMGKQAVIRLLPSSKLDAFSWCQTISQRLEKALESDLRPGQVVVRREWRGYVIYVGHTYLLTVPQAQARIRRVSEGNLAYQWAARLREGIASLPALDLAPSRTVIPLGESRTIAIRKNFPGEVTVTLSDPSILQYSLDPARKRLTLTGLREGWAGVTVAAGGREAMANAWIRDWAGVIPKIVNLQITGKPARNAFLEGVVLDALSTEIQVRDGATMKVGTRAVSPPQVLYAGEEASFAVPVKVTGKEYLPVARNVLVRLENVPLKEEDTAYLMVSNRPENVTRSGILFSESFPDQRPIRLLYHHKNGTKSHLFLAVKVHNPSPSPTRIHVIGAQAGPYENELQVGHVSAYQFLDSYKAFEGKVITIPPQGSHFLVYEKIFPSEVLTGIVQMKLLDGSGGESTEHPQVTVEAREKNILEDPSLAPLDSPGKKHAKGIFPSPDLYLEKEFRVGEPFTFIPIGKFPLSELYTQEPNYGNYGVLYKIKVTMDNPTDSQATVRIVFVPTAGVAGGTFIINEQIIRAPLTAPFKEVTLARYVLEPGESRSVVIFTLPQGGSFYPVNLVIRS